MKVASVASTVRERFDAKVDRSGGPDACWPWTGTLMKTGYGQMKVAGRPYGAHRLAAAWVRALPLPLPRTHTDHLCHDPALCALGIDCPHRRCCNPAHLDIVTPRANNERSGSPTAQNASKVECPEGHAYDDANTYIDKRGRRSCKACMRAANRRWVASGGTRNVQPPRTCPECGRTRAARGFRNGICGACDARQRRAA